jgi:hypothetical protein
MKIEDIKFLPCKNWNDLHKVLERTSGPHSESPCRLLVLKCQRPVASLPDNKIWVHCGLAQPFSWSSNSHSAVAVGAPGSKIN